MGDTAKALTYGIALGAGVMFLLDPREGGRRRALIRDKSIRAAHELEEATGIGARDLSHRAEGIVAKLRRPTSRVDLDDDIVVERVRSALGRTCSHPHAIAVKPRGTGCVELAGPILAGELHRVLDTVSRVRGVVAIDNDLEVHERPGEVAALQGVPAKRSARVRFAPGFKLLVGASAAALGLASVVSGHPLGLLVGGGLTLAIARSMTSRRPILPRQLRSRIDVPHLDASTDAPRVMPGFPAHA